MPFHRLGGADGLHFEKSWLDLASDHNGDTDASHHALDDRGDLAAYLPNNRPKQAKADERSRCPRSVRCPDLGFLCNGFSDFARDVKPSARVVKGCEPHQCFQRERSSPNLRPDRFCHLANV